MLTLITKETLRSHPNGYGRNSTGAKRALKRKTKKSTSRQKTANRQPAKWQATQRARPKQTSRRPATSRTELPAWSDLQADATPRLSRTENYFAQISTPRFFLLIFALAAACTLYVGHVHATQQTLALLQDEKQNNLRLHLKYNRLKSAFDANTGPAVIYERAIDLGLEQSIIYGPTIEIKNDKP